MNLRARSWVYSARVSLDHTKVQIEDKMVELALGMAVTVKIKASERRIIEISVVLLCYRLEAVRER